MQDLWRGERRAVLLLSGAEISAEMRMERALRRRTVWKSEGAIFATNERYWSECEGLLLA
jgi:hypothetical protein